MTLTDEDRAAVANLYDAEADGTMGEKFYAAGIRAGMERAAMVCDSLPMTDVALYAANKWNAAALVRNLCAQRIREAAK